MSTFIRNRLPYLGARFFDGSSGYFSFGTLANVIPPISMAAWVRPNVLTGSKSIISTTTNGIQLRLNGNAPELLKTNAVSIAVAAGRVPVGAWTHVGCTYDGTIWQLFINGEFDSSGSNNQTIGSFSTVNVGRNTGSLSEFFSGGMADVVAWNLILPRGIFRRMGKEGIPSAYVFTNGTTNTHFNMPMQTGGNGNEIMPYGPSATATKNGTVTTCDGPGMKWFRSELIALEQPAASAVVFRKTLSQIGGRIGTRQIQGWAN